MYILHCVTGVFVCVNDNITYLVLSSEEGYHCTFICQLSSFHATTMCFMKVHLTFNIHLHVTGGKTLSCTAVKGKLGRICLLIIKFTKP